MAQGDIIRSKTFIATKASVDCHKGVVMADMLDRQSNRLHFHKRVDGEFVFDAFYLKDRVKGNTDAELKNIIDVIKLLKQHGVTIIYSAENEGKTIT